MLLTTPIQNKHSASKIKSRQIFFVLSLNINFNFWKRCVIIPCREGTPALIPRATTDAWIPDRSLLLVFFCEQKHFMNESTTLQIISKLQSKCAVWKKHELETFCKWSKYDKWQIELRQCTRLARGSGGSACLAFGALGELG